jgi:hypothetical protein
MKKREEQSGLWFSTNTPQGVRNAILNARQFDRRIRIYYGDTLTGKPWLEENNITGKIGRSTGPEKIPLLINNSRSLGGGAILDHCIVAIQTTDDKRFVYRHVDFELPKLSLVIDETMPELPFCVYHENKLQARFDYRNKAERYIGFITGKKMSK